MLIIFLMNSFINNYVKSIFVLSIPTIQVKKENQTETTEELKIQKQKTEKKKIERYDFFFPSQFHKN